MGLHVRPCNAILQAVKRFHSELYLRRLDGRGVPQGEEVRARSAASLLLLEAPLGTDLELRAVGPDARELLEEVEKLFQLRFMVE
jgi:phosphocarrier protein HPr